MSLVNVATCSLGQLALDFKRNQENIMHSIRLCKAQGCRVRIGPELEVCGYGCEDHFFEDDTLRHSWEVLEEIVRSDVTDGILCDIGIPVMHDGVRYNCRVLVMNRRLLMLRPKMWLAEDGAYREGRWFSGWAKGFHLDQHILPRRIRDATGQSTVPFGVGLVQFGDTLYANETCEELFTANNPGITLALSGAEIIGNGSGSHHSLLKIERRTQLIEEQTKKTGGVYLYSNQIGCDGGRLYFDGGSIVAANGSVVAQGSQFTIADVETVVATVDLRDVRRYRGSIASRGRQAAACPSVPRVDCRDIDLAVDTDTSHFHSSTPAVSVRRHTLEEECAFGPACWLWDYLRRSNLSGLFLPLSGGADSAMVACLAYIMCDFVYRDIVRGDASSQALSELQRIIKDRTFVPRSAKEVCSRLLYTCYMATDGCVPEKAARAEALAEALGAKYHAVDLEPMVRATLQVYESIGPTAVATEERGGTTQSAVASQNVIGRSRMLMSYLCAQKLKELEFPGTEWPGQLLVLGSANMDEALRGYFTKYDCSSADVNIIGGMPKVVIRRVLSWIANTYDIPALGPIVAAHEHDQRQTLEGGETGQRRVDEMGLSYEQLDMFGRLRMDGRCGPVSMYHKLRTAWEGTLSPAAVAAKVKGFFRYYAQNRHKVTTLPPTVHLASHAADDNRSDLRQIVYNTAWPWQFERIDRMAERDEAAHIVAQSARKRARDV